MATPLLTSAEKTDRLLGSYRRGFTPPPRISVPDWADRYRKLAKEAGSTSGRWMTETVEVARGPMLAVTEPGVHIITTMVGTQMLKTALLENVFGFFAHLDPCPMLLLQPKDEAARQFSKERISPMVRATPALKALIGSRKTRNSDEEILFKSFPGGFLALAGAGSPDNLARRPIRVLLCDEVDKYIVTREGEPIALAEERTASFGLNWLSLRACSPTVEDESRIDKSYKSGDQRRASLECPHCSHRMFPEFFKHVEWQKDEQGQNMPETARIFCEACGVGWSEGERLRALRTIRWHQTKSFYCCGSRHSPLDDYDRAWREDDATGIEAVWSWWSGARFAVYRAKCPTCGELKVGNTHASFQAGKIFSPWQKDRPADIAKKWLDAAGDEDLKQTWWNTQMGLPYRAHAGKELRLEALAARCEHWGAEVPDGVGILTASMDTQDYRVEIEVVGWGRNEESWSIDHHVIDGEFSDPNVQAQVDAYLKRIWRRADGRGFEIAAACLDSGGHHTQDVYEFCKTRLGRRIWAVKGESAQQGQRNPVWPTKRPSKRNKSSFRPVILGVNAAKDKIRNYLHLEEPGAGYMHFPSDRDINYFAQLTAERSIVKEQSGKRFRVWELPSGKANEALDLRVYNYAALCGLIHLGLKLNRRTEQVMTTKYEPGDEPELEAPGEAQEVTQPSAPKPKISLAERMAMMNG